MSAYTAAVPLWAGMLLGAGGFLFGLGRQVAAFSRSEDWPVWILFSARPLSMALSKWWGRLALLLLAVAHALLGQFHRHIIPVLWVDGKMQLHPAPPLARPVRAHLLPSTSP